MGDAMENEAVQEMEKRLLAQDMATWGRTGKAVKTWVMEVYMPHAMAIDELLSMSLVELLASASIQAASFLCHEGCLPTSAKELDDWS